MISVTDQTPVHLTDLFQRIAHICFVPCAAAYDIYALSSEMGYDIHFTQGSINDLIKDYWDTEDIHTVERLFDLAPVELPQPLCKDLLHYLKERLLRYSNILIDSYDVDRILKMMKECKHTCTSPYLITSNIQILAEEKRKTAILKKLTKDDFLFSDRSTGNNLLVFKFTQNGQHYLIYLCAALYYPFLSEYADLNVSIYPIKKEQANEINAVPILDGRRLYNGFEIHGECVMLDRNGKIYACIDNILHPNPGTLKKGYPEIERTVDWLYANDIQPIKPILNEWIQCRVFRRLDEESTIQDEIVHAVMHNDAYIPCDAEISQIMQAYHRFQTETERHHYTIYEEIALAKEIADFVNETFLRVRAGGKADSFGENAIYFRISSHGYNWYPLIMNFLHSVFGAQTKMPDRIWIGHDGETNPPEIILYDGEPKTLYFMTECL